MLTKDEMDFVIKLLTHYDPNRSYFFDKLLEIYFRKAAQEIETIRISPND